MTSRVTAILGEPSLQVTFERALARLMSEGGYLCGWSDAAGLSRPLIQVALSRVETPQRVTAELTLPEGAPHSSVWHRVDDPPATAAAHRTKREQTWRFDCSVATSSAADALYRELVEALGGGREPARADAIHFEYGGLVPGRAQRLARWVVAPGLAASMGFLAGLLLVAAGETSERAATLATVSAIVGLGSTLVPALLLARLARRWPRLRAGSLADGIIFASLLSLPIVVIALLSCGFAILDGLV